MNKRRAFLALVMVCALCVLPILGSVNVSAAGNGYFVTNGVSLSADEENTIGAMLNKVANETGIDVVVYICDSLASTGKSSAQAAADDYYDYNGYGKEGVLFLWLVEEQTAHISTTSGTASRILYDNAQSQVWADMQSSIKSGDYVTAFTHFTDDLSSYYAEYLADNEAMRNAGPRYGLTGIIAVVVGALSGLIRSSVLKGQLKSVAEATTAADYIKQGSFNLTRSGDVFLYRTVERTRRQNDSDDKSSAIHTSSSGAQHGGNTFK